MVKRNLLVGIDGSLRMKININLLYLEVSAYGFI